jgi:hypothetical protein
MQATRTSVALTHGSESCCGRRESEREQESERESERERDRERE